MKSFNVTTAVRRLVSTLTLVVSGLLLALPSAAQINMPPTWVFARDYNGWQILSQGPSTYTWNGLACTYTPKNPMGISGQFFDFSGVIGGSTVYFPIFIQDANQALSEIVTPTATVNTQSACGFTATTVNAHTTFLVSSGTIGLQEAIANQTQNLPQSTVVLDKFWYQQVAALPGPTTAQAIIKGLTGSVNVTIVDVTTAPWVSYEWNGTNYVQTPFNGSNGFSSTTAVSAPTALSTGASTNGLITTATTGGTIPASSTYRLAATYVTALGGETLISTDSASTATIATGSGTATNTISVTSPAAATGAVGWRLYVTAAGGSTGTEILYVPTCLASTGQIVLNGVCAIGSTATVTAIVTGTATVPAISTAYPALYSNPGAPIQGFQSVYGPQTVLASVAAAATATIGEVNFPTGFLNTLGRHIHLHGTGYATTNSTPGTLTIATTLASVPGVTSITPFTAVSGTTTASAVVNFIFDVDYTTTTTGSSGTLEAHGVVHYNLAGTAVDSPAMDLIIAASSTIDLTKQNQLAVTIKPTTTATTNTQLRQMTVQVIE